MDLLASTSGLDPCRLGIIESLGEFGRLGRRLLLQSLALANGIFQLLLNFCYPSFMSAVGGLFGLQLGSRFVSSCLIRLRLLFGLGKGASEGLDLSLSNYAHNPSIT